jgi:hypothetical protein
MCLAMSLREDNEERKGKEEEKKVSTDELNFYIVSNDRSAFDVDDALRYIRQISGGVDVKLLSCSSSLPNEIGKYHCSCSSETYDFLEYSYTFTSKAGQDVTVSLKPYLKQTEVVIERVDQQPFGDLDPVKLEEKVWRDYRVKLTLEEKLDTTWIFKVDESYIDTVLKLPSIVVLNPGSHRLQLSRKQPKETVLKEALNVVQADKPPGSNMFWAFHLVLIEDSSTANTIVPEKLTAKDAEGLKEIIFTMSGVALEVYDIHDDFISCSCLLSNSKKLARFYHMNRLLFRVKQESIWLKFARRDEQPIDAVTSYPALAIEQISWKHDLFMMLKENGQETCSWTFLCDADQRDRLLDSHQTPLPLVVDLGLEELVCR